MNDNSITSNRQETARMLNVASGSLAGFSTGLIVSFWEAAKVRSQTQTIVRFKDLFSANFYTTPIKQGIMLPFSALFAGVCGIEFSVNEEINHKYGIFSGIAASSLTGASFLTVADHIMYKQQENKKSPLIIFKQLLHLNASAPWTGFTAVTIREGFWISSVSYFGPHMGNHLRHLFNGNPENTESWSCAGRLMTGVISAIASQPFDVIAREMQKNLAENPQQKKNLTHAVTKIFQKCVHEKSMVHFFRGGLPRLGLATMGGVLAGGFFDSYKKLLIKNELPQENKKICATHR